MFRHALRTWLSGPTPPLLLCSLLSMAMLVCRLLQSRSPVFVFLAWNLVLAWVPLLASSAAARRLGRGRWGWMGLLLLVVWLAFFPNAPYLLTDFVHLRQRRLVPLWYDIGLLGAFAWTGMLLAVTSLQQVHQLVRKRHGRWVGWVTVAAASLLAGAGVFVGRFLRWNSWDLVTRPSELAADVSSRFLQSGAYPQAWGVTLVFGALLFAVYATWNAQRSVAGLHAQLYPIANATPSSTAPMPRSHNCIDHANRNHAP